MTAPRRRLRALGTLAMMNGLIPMRTQPLYLINTVASPLSFLFFIWVASKGTLLLYAIAGGMVLTMLSVGTSLQSDMAHYKVDLKFQDLVVASPVEAPVYVMGMALSEFVYSIPGMAVFVALWLWNIHPVTALGVATVLGVVILVWAFASALGFTLATYLEDVRETFVFSPLISLGLTVLPPVYYPISVIPAALQPLAYVAPTTDAAQLLHQAFNLDPVAVLPAVRDWLVLLAFTVGLVLLAATKARWREP